LRLIFRSTQLKTQHRHFQCNALLICTANFTYAEYVHQKLANLQHVSANQGAIIRESYRLPSLRAQNGPMCLNMLEIS